MATVLMVVVVLGAVGSVVFSRLMRGYGDGLGWPSVGVIVSLIFAALGSIGLAVVSLF